MHITKKMTNCSYLSAMKVLKMMTLMMIIYLAQLQGVFYCSSYQFHSYSSIRIVDNFWNALKKKKSTYTYHLLWNYLYLWDVPWSHFRDNFYFKKKKVQKDSEIVIQALEYKLMKTMIHSVFFHVSRKSSSYFNMSEIWQIFEK